MMRLLAVAAIGDGAPSRAWRGAAAHAGHARPKVRSARAGVEVGIWRAVSGLDFGTRNPIPGPRP